MRVRVSQVKPSNCFILHPTPIIVIGNIYGSMIFFLGNIPVPDSLQAPRKISVLIPSICLFWTQVFHPWWYETCKVIQQQFWMKECKILGAQNILWLLLHTFRVSRPTSTPRIYAWTQQSLRCTFFFTWSFCARQDATACRVHIKFTRHNVERRSISSGGLQFPTRDIHTGFLSVCPSEYYVETCRRSFFFTIW